MPPLETLTFFIDRSLGRTHVAEALRRVGARVVIHDDYFAPDAPDTEWLGRAGAEGWIVLTKDRRIRYRALEREALLEANVRAFVLTTGSATGEAMGQAFVTALRQIRVLVERQPPPFLATVSATGAAVLANVGKENRPKCGPAERSHGP